jgi:hypothetical protein
MTPQIIMLCLYLLILVLHAAKHGTWEVREFHVGKAGVAVLLGFLLLWWGNFWAPIGLPGPL